MINLEDILIKEIMNFDTSKNKLDKLDAKSTTNEREINSQQLNNKTINNDMRYINKGHNSLGQEINYNQKWTIFSLLGGNYSEENGIGTWEDDYSWQAKGFDIDIGIFDIRLLSSFKVSLLVKPIDVIDKHKIIEYSNSAVFFELKEIGNSNKYLKNVIIHISMEIEDFRTSLPDIDNELKRLWQIKPLIKYNNPRYYI